MPAAVRASLLGRYDRDPVALRIFGTVLVASSLMRLLIWLYVTGRPHLMWRRLGLRQRRAGLAISAAPAVAYALAVLLAGPAPAVSLTLYGAMPVLYFLGITLLRGTRRRDEEYADFT